MTEVKIARFSWDKKYCSAHDINEVLDNMKHATFFDSHDCTMMVVDTRHLSIENMIGVTSMDEICQHLEDFHTYHSIKGPIRIVGAKGFSEYNLPEDLHMVLIEVGVGVSGYVYFIHEDTPDIKYIITQHN